MALIEAKDREWLPNTLRIPLQQLYLPLWGSRRVEHAEPIHGLELSP